MDQFPNNKSSNTSYQLITNLGSFSLETIPVIAKGLRLIMNEFLNKEQIQNKRKPPPYQSTRYPVICPPPTNSLYNRKECVSGYFTNISDELVLYIVKDLDSLNIRALTPFCKRFLVIIRPEWSLIHRNSPRILDCRQLKTFLNKKQIPYKLRIYSVGSYPVGSSLMKLPDDWKEYVSEGFTNFSLDIIRYITNYLNDFDIRALKQISKRIFAIMRREWPQIIFYVALWSNEMIEYSQKRDLYNICMKFHKQRATNNSNMDSVCYLDGRMNQYPPHKMKMDPSRWTFMRLKDGTNNYRLNQSWVHYLKECVNLVYLRLIDTSDLYLNIANLTKMERFFMKLKPVNGWGAEVTLPSSMKTIVVYATEESYQKHHTQFSERYIYYLQLNALKCTQFKFL
jgi:hypothetical protein